jgi:hypothetical protein
MNTERGFGHTCSSKDCHTEAWGFDSFAAAEAHARGHLEAMLERLRESGEPFVLTIDNDGVGLEISKGTLRATVEAALKEAKG